VLVATVTNAHCIEKLAESCKQYRGLDPRDFLELVANPQWGKAHRTNDWRNHVPDAVAERWADLSLEARLVAYLIAVVESSLE
jgi:hypothetical protein